MKLEITTVFLEPIVDLQYVFRNLIAIKIPVEISNRLKTIITVFKLIENSLVGLDKAKKKTRSNSGFQIPSNANYLLFWLHEIKIAKGFALINVPFESTTG